jgi:hypothetical protein
VAFTGPCSLPGTAGVGGPLSVSQTGGPFSFTFTDGSSPPVTIIGTGTVGMDGTFSGTVQMMTVVDTATATGQGTFTGHATSALAVHDFVINYTASLSGSSGSCDASGSIESIAS